ALTKLQETAMSRKTKLNEEDTQMDDLDVDADADAEGGGELTLKLTGLPDDVDLDGIGVDLVSGDDDEGGDDVGDLDLDVGDDEGGEDEGGDLDMDFGGGQDTRLEGVMGLSDDTVVEIDENMLRREIKRMRALREETAPTADGHGVDAAAMDDFGGGASEGEPLDVDLRDVVAEPLGEGEMPEELPEADGMGMPVESIARKRAFEKKIQERAKARAAQLQKEARRASGKKLQALKLEY